VKYVRNDSRRLSKIHSPETPSDLNKCVTPRQNSAPWDDTPDNATCFPSTNYPPQDPTDNAAQDLKFDDERTRGAPANKDDISHWPLSSTSPRSRVMSASRVIPPVEVAEKEGPFKTRHRRSTQITHDCLKGGRTRAVKRSSIPHRSCSLKLRLHRLVSPRLRRLGTCPCRTTSTPTQHRAQDLSISHKRIISADRYPHNIKLVLCGPGLKAAAPDGSRR
jgi:hypothetical protein